MTESCSNCKHWRQGKENAPFGRCVRFQPTVIFNPEDNLQHTVFPHTDNDDYCFEHAPKPPRPLTQDEQVARVAEAIIRVTALVATIEARVFCHPDVYEIVSKAAGEINGNRRSNKGAMVIVEKYDKLGPGRITLVDYKGEMKTIKVPTHEETA